MVAGRVDVDQDARIVDHDIDRPIRERAHNRLRAFAQICGSQAVQQRRERGRAGCEDLSLA